MGLSSVVVEDEPVIARIDQAQWSELCWDASVPKMMKSFEGALIRRADVAFEA